MESMAAGGGGGVLTQFFSRKKEFFFKEEGGGRGYLPTSLLQYLAAVERKVKGATIYARRRERRREALLMAKGEIQ